MSDENAPTPDLQFEVRKVDLGLCRVCKQPESSSTGTDDYRLLQEGFPVHKSKDSKYKRGSVL